MSDSQMTLSTAGNDRDLEKTPATSRGSTEASYPSASEGDQTVTDPPPPIILLDRCTRNATLTIAGAWLVQFCTFGYVYAFGVYQDYYTREFLTTNSPSEISWIGSLQLFLMYAPGVAVGRAFDGGYFHHVEILGALIYVFSIFMLSLTQKGQYYQVFLAQAVGMGLGLGLTFLPSLSIVSHHFRVHRALATGIVVTGASCGGIVFPIMLNHLFSNPNIGFANDELCGEDEEDELVDDGDCEGGGQGWGLYDFYCWASTLDLSSGCLHSETASNRAFCTGLGIFFPYFYLQLYAVEQGINNTLSSYSLTILNAGSTIGRLIPPFLADRLGVYNILIPSILSAAAMLFAVFGVRTAAGVIIEGLLFGFFSGAYVSLIPPLLATLSRDMNELGFRMGLAFTAVGFAMLTGNPIAGALLGTGRTDGGMLIWWRAIVFAGVVTLVGFALMLVSRTLFISSRRKDHQKV
ncbi:major facilitator superfamily domain-containing protein [Cristinia sonorae]|uniref:Major facilitator superfamily domain-containing protein n=1 Tax=Cristinia sonorae TaxID=1940300 RepID=A0A8K0URA6_9AGAR|nr:major facilitator superfamily domain-containing protein [Cristinia sonorae]